MNDLFFCIGREHVESGEFLPGEIGRWAVRWDADVCLVIPSRREAERVWAIVAPHHGYAHN